MGLPLTPSAALPLDPAGDSAAHSSPCTFSLTPPAELRQNKQPHQPHQTRIQSHILASPNFNQHQSAYRPGHSTETALVQLLDSIYHAADNGKATLAIFIRLKCLCCLSALTQPHNRFATRLLSCR